MENYLLLTGMEPGSISMGDQRGRLEVESGIGGGSDAYFDDFATAMKAFIEEGSSPAMIGDLTNVETTLELLEHVKSAQDKERELMEHEKGRKPAEGKHRHREQTYVPERYLSEDEEEAEDKPEDEAEDVSDEENTDLTRFIMQEVAEEEFTPIADLVKYKSRASHSYPKMVETSKIFI